MILFTPSQRQWLEAQAEARSMTVYDVLRRLVRDAMRAKPEPKQRQPRRKFAAQFDHHIKQRNQVAARS